jgi:hypothetical protein
MCSPVRFVPSVPFVLVALLALLPSCGDQTGPGWTNRSGSLEPSPTLYFDSLRLGEDSEAYIGQPVSLMVEPSEIGSGIDRVWVSDHFANTIVRFGPDGSVEGRLGNPGPGPHELQGVTLVFRAGPQEIGVVDLRNREVKWFHQQDGTVLRASQHGSGFIAPYSRPISLESGGKGSLLFPMMDQLTGTPLGILDLESEKWARKGLVPDGYRNSLQHGSGAFFWFFSNVLVDRLPDGGILVGFGGDENLFRFDPVTGKMSRLGTVPSRFRKGLTPDLWRSFDIPSEYGEGLPFDWASVLFGAWVLSDGRIAVVHMDQTPQGEPPALQLTATSYLTLLDPEGDTACVDLLVPGGDEIRPVFDMRSDVLYVLDRRLGADLDAVTWLLKLPVPPMDACPEAHRDSGWLDPGAGAVLP